MENKKVLLIITDGFEDIEALGTVALLRRAKIEVDIFSLRKENIVGSYGTNLSLPVFNNKDNNIDLSIYDLLFIAGGKEYVELESSSTFIDVIKYFYNHDKYIAAICAGPTILGHLGYLKNKKYTCFKSMNEDFNGTYIPKYSVVDGKIITGISAAGVIDFAFNIISTLKGEEYSEMVKNSIYYYDK